AGLGDDELFCVAGGCAGGGAFSLWRRGVAATTALLDCIVPAKPGVRLEFWKRGLRFGTFAKMFYHYRRMKASLGAKTLVYPTPVFVVGTYDKDGKPNVMTASWGGICYSQPPCVAVSLRK